MRNRIVAIFVCALLANVVNYALGVWLEDNVISTISVPLPDGSSLVNSVTLGKPFAGSLPDPAEQALIFYYDWLQTGKSESYELWRMAIGGSEAITDNPFLQRALNLADNTNASRYLALLLLIITMLMLWGKAFKESQWITPLLYFGVTLGTVALYGSLDAPFYTLVVAGAYVVYFVGIRLSLPIFHTEWCRMMRPFLTLQIFLLAVIAFRGPELVDYWFWTSPLFRLALTFVTLMTVFFHLAIVFNVLGKGLKGTAARYFGYGMPLGFTLIVLGLVLGFYGPAAGSSLQEINFELVTLPEEIVAGINPEAPFLLTGAGILLTIVSGIGYFIQRIAR